MRGLKAALVACVAGASLYAQSASRSPAWDTYSGGAEGRRYSPLNQINTTNVSKLKLAWQYGAADAGAALSSVGRSQAVPIFVRGVLYTSTARRTIVALDPETGKEIWKYDLDKGGAPNRGVSYWPGEGRLSPRILAGTTDGRLLALDAATGKPVPTFGDQGAIDLRVGVAEKFPKMPYLMASPGTIYRNLIITGAQGQEDNPEGPAMDVRAWDVRTGKLVWTFHTIPHPGEPGYETWPADYFKTAGSPANWGFGSVDAERGLVFLPIGQPASQYYGGHRVQQNLYSSSVVALDANTGKVRWHFQLTHHDVWDYDNAATPALMDVVRNGRRIPAVVTVAKSGLMFFLERETGKPIYPVEERPVPQSDIPGEQNWPTQPFPVKPPPLSRLSIKPDEIFTGEPMHEKFCRDLVEKIGGIHNLGPYTPYSSREFRILFPGQQGGPNFGGVAIDQSLGYVFVNSRDVGGMGRLDKTPEGDQVAYRRFSPLGRGTVNARFWNPETSLPCQPPPWAHLMAVNANTGDIVWKVPLGTSDELESKGLKNTGAFGQGGPIVTAGGLVFIAGTIDKRFRAFDSRTGQMLWEGKLEAEGHTTPMTYIAPNGKQYVVVVTTTTGVNAFALEESQSVSAAACEGLARSLSFPNATVSGAEAVAAGKFVPPGGGAAAAQRALNLPAFCRVALTLAPSPDSDIKSEVWLPMSGWNGKFLQVGNGAWGGSIQYGPLGDALRRGYAAASTDTGHTGTDASFAMGHPEKLIDFGYRSVHETARVGKATVAALYGDRPRLSYFNGCSGGGRMSFMEAQRFPEDFDGIIAGAPGYNRTDVAFQTLGMAQATHVSPASFIPAGMYPALRQAALDKCDALDGLKDGLIADPTTCRFDPAVLECRGAGQSGCLTKAQVVAARKIYAPVIDPKTGAQISSGLEPGSELQWGGVAGNQPHPMYNDLLRFVVMKDPNWDYRTLDVSQQLALARKSDNGVLSATSTELTPFVSRGGKLLIYHGWGDQNIPPRESVNYYNGVVKTMGMAKVADAVRLFMVPGMGHCGGGDGPNEFDMVTVLEQWREHGKPPTEVLASQVNEGRVVRTRPLCPYPQIAMYKSSGSIDRAESFVCRTNGVGLLPATAQVTGAQPNSYQVVANHFKLPEGRTMGSTAAIDIDRDGRSVWVFERCGGASQALACAASNLAPVLKFHSSGQLVSSFGAGMFVSPHGIHVDRQGNIWLVDGAAKDGKGDQVFKFSPEGKVLMTLGKAGVAGDGPDAFNPPSDVLVAPNGDVFVADGHGGNTNARIVKFSKDGTLVKTWGKKGSGPGEFDTPHSLAMDSSGRLFVADRGNSRIQVFDQDGKFVAEWKQFGRPSGIYIDKNDVLYAADTQSDEKTNPGYTRGIRIGSAKDGSVTALIPDADPDGTGEGVAADADGNIYGALTGKQALKRYVKSAKGSTR